MAPQAPRIENQSACGAGRGEWTSAERQLFHRILAEQRECLDVKKLNLKRAAEGVMAWIARTESMSVTRSRARAFAALAWPIMPRLCQSIWQSTGIGGRPNRACVEATVNIERGLNHVADRARDLRI